MGLAWFRLGEAQDFCELTLQDEAGLTPLRKRLDGDFVEEAADEGDGLGVALLVGGERLLKVFDRPPVVFDDAGVKLDDAAPRAHGFELGRQRLPLFFELGHAPIVRLRDGIGNDVVNDLVLSPRDFCEPLRNRGAARVGGLCEALALFVVGPDVFRDVFGGEEAGADRFEDARLGVGERDGAVVGARALFPMSRAAEPLPVAHREGPAAHPAAQKPAEQMSGADLSPNGEVGIARLHLLHPLPQVGLDDSQLWRIDHDPL